MAYKKDDNGGQAAVSAAPSRGSSGGGGGSRALSSGGSKAAVKESSSGAGKSYSSGKASAKASSSGQGKVYSGGPVGGGGSSGGSMGESLFSKSVSAGSRAKKGTTASFDAAMSPAWVGKNPYQWGNTSTIVNHWDDRDPERQAKLNALGFAADDPDRTFHFYEPDKGSPKSYLDQANALSSDRNYYQAGNFWNTINGSYASEEDRVSDAMEWMKDAQIYGKWAKDHDLTYTDENGEERSMEEAWKEIWSYANDIAGGIGDSDSTRAKKDIQSYLTGGEYSSEQTKQLLEQARQFSENAESEKDAKLWSELEQSLNIQLKDDEKREKREGTFLGKASDFFAAPEKEQVEYTPEEQKGRETLEGEYNRLKAQYQEASAYATDPAQLQELDGMKAQLDALEQQIKDDNRAHGREVYDGLGADTRAADAFEGWAGGRAANVGAVAGTILNWVDSASDDMVRYEYDQEHGEGAWDRAVKANPELENYLDLGETGNRLMEGAQANKVASDQLWSDYQEDMSDFGKLISNVVRGGADLALNAAENAFVPGSGAFSMYMQAAGGGALEQAGRENNDPDSVAAAAVVRGVGAWFSNRLVGGVEAVYGKSVLGGIADNLIKGASPAAQKTIKTLLNSEGIEEGLEDMLNYAADRILGLDGDASLDWNEVKQDAMIGYILGVLTNGLAGGMNYDQAARHRIVDGGIEAAESGLAPQEIERIARESTKEDVVIKPGNAETSQETENVTSQDTGVSSQVTPEQATEMAQSQTAALEGQETAPQAAPVQAPATSGPAADASKPYEGPTLPGASYGGEARVKVGNTKIPVHFAVVPISELNVSHDIYGNQNQNYPAELQPRDRSRGTAQNQAIQIGANLDPEELEWSNNATTGAPIIRPDGTVISGNGRTLGISYALQSGRGSDYIQHIRDNAARFGIDPNSIGEDSVLVRVADGDYNWQAMAEQANVSDVSRMSATEQAGVDAERLSRYPEILSKLVPNDTGDLSTSDNADFVKDFLQAVVPASEQGDVWTEEGGFSQSGMRRVQNAIFQMAYGDAGLMSRLSESLDNNMKNVSNSMLALAPKVAALENNVENGTRYIGIRDAILDGVKIFETAKNRGVEVGKVVDQISMDGNASPEAVFIAEFLQGNAKSAKQIRTFLNAMADTAEDFGDPTQIGFFDTGDTEYTSKDVLEGAIARYEQETGNQLGRPDYDFYGDVFDTGVNRESEGADSAETDAAADRSAESAGENTGSGDTGRAGDLASRMESGEVGEEEYLNLVSSEEGRTQLANILGLNSNDTKTVADGLSVYLLLQDQLNQLQGQQNQDTAGMLLGEEAETNSIPPAPDNPEQGAGKTQTWHDLKNVVTDSPNAAITSSNSEYGTSYTVYSHDENGNTSFRPFDSYAEAKAYYDYLNGNPSSYTEDVFTGWGTQEGAETSQSVQGNPTGVNSQAEETNSTTGMLNTQETAGNANPEQNDTGTRRTGTGNTGTNGNTDADFDALVAKNGAIEAGENPARDINVPRKDTAGNKVGEGTRTIMEAEATPESRLGNLKAAVVNGNFGHVPVTNDARSKNAAAKIAKDGWKKSVGDFLGAVNSGKSDPDTIALGAHLLNEAGNAPGATGRDYVELAMAYNEAMTRAGQGLAAGRILKTLTPEGKLYGFEKTVEKINKDIRQKNEKRAPARQKPEVKLNEKLAEDFLNAKTDAERDAIHDKMVKDVAQQVPNTLRDKFTALRYLNMLGNLKTQVRNVVGNIGMSAVQKTKNELVSVMEGIAEAASGGKYKRQYKGFYGTDLLRTARADFGSDEALQKAAKGEAKYSDVGKQAMADIKDAKDPFSNKHPLGKFLNLYSKATNAAMEYGDLVFVRANYADALAGYLNAHNISSAQWEAMVSDPNRAADVDKARNYAIKQAQEATFRDTNAVSKFVSTMDKDFPRLAKAITQGVIPFRKTPANVLVRMEEYSPLGLVNTAVNGVKAARGEASASDVIDSMAKTITGTGLAALGFFLRSKGWARTKDKDDKEEALAKLRGSQDYSIEFTLPNGKRKSFTLDWLTPASGSFFMGSELFDIVDDGGITPANAMTVLSSFTNPMLEMSMLSGVNDALSNLSDFNGDNSAMAQFVLNSAWSYLTQGISNTLAGQAEQFNEAYRQTYYTDPDNPFLPTSVQKKLAKLGNKTPGKDYQAADYIDAWGRKQKNDENLGTRAFNVFANPGYVSNMDEKTTAVDDLLADLYQFGKTQTERDTFPDVVPKTPSRSTTVNGEKLTPEEYDLYATTKGREALDAITEFSKSDTFKNMDEFAQAETISDIYSYSAFLAASRIAESRGETYYDDRYSPLIRGVDKNGAETYKATIKRGDIPEYLAFKNAYDSAMDSKDYDAIDALLDSADSLPVSARDGAIDRADKMGTLMDLKDAGLSSASVYYQFQDDMKNIYEGEKRTAPKSSDYIRAAGSGRYSPKDADAIMNYETAASEKTVARYQDQVRYNLEMAGMGGNYSEVWHMVQSVADGDMTKDQLKSYVERNLPIEYRQAIRDVASNYAEDRHVAGKTVSGIYRAAREAGATPKQALEFYNLIDTNYNGSYTKKEFDAACRQMFGTGEAGRQVRAALQDYVGK